MDSRNQMLCGYYAFGEFEFPRACLKLIASDNRPDGLLNIVYRIMGKKEIGKLSIIDLIVSILIAELAAISIEQYEKSILISIIPIICLVVIEMFFSYIGIKSPKFRKIVEGSPVVIIKNGKLNFEAMSKLRYSLDDLVTQLREQSIKNIEEVNYAVLENNGKLSIFEKETEYPLPIILDGQID